MLITGGNSDIGRATAILAVQEGARVAIGARVTGHSVIVDSGVSASLR